jgi:quercetin dioxygenase-like cupin family protein
MLKHTSLGALAVTGTIYDFPEAGDELPIHIHAHPGENHITIVARGCFRIEGHPDHAGRILTAGDVADWPLGVAHGFVALEPNSRLVNVRKSA